MRATIEYIEYKFKEYNELIFEGKLPLLPFKVTNARTYLGAVCYLREKNADETWHYYGFVFKISTVVDLPEEEVEDTIIHEMIHYYIMYNQMQDTSPHGEIFTRLMRDINVKFNRNISVVHKATKEEHDTDIEKREHIICVSRFKTNQYGITIVNKSKLLQLWDEMAKIPKVAETMWYVSSDSYFNRYPRAASVKIYPIPHSELEEHLAGAKTLVRTGNYIKISK